jgi:cellulose synthase/poly-beta-1,6-N-acetylglucosamine synthase-like glycosyltransferase
MLTVIVPCFNEENYIGACLQSILHQRDLPEDHRLQVIISANGCQDRTVEVAEGHRAAFEAAGMSFTVLDIAKPGKVNAINMAEAAAVYPDRVFVDADVVLGATILVELAALLGTPEPVYASGTVMIPRAKSWVTRAYAKVWSALPFVRDGVPGIGVYAVNEAGRKRWAAFPEIIADDRFVRLNFAPDERRKARAEYLWPLPEGFWNMIKARRRWCEGSDELLLRYPALLANDSQRNKDSANLRSVLRHPLAGSVFVVIYAISAALANTRREDATIQWRRGRT